MNVVTFDGAMFLADGELRTGSKSNDAKANRDGASKSNANSSSSSSSSAAAAAADGLGECQLRTRLEHESHRRGAGGKRGGDTGFGGDAGRDDGRGRAATEPETDPKEAERHAARLEAAATKASIKLVSQEAALESAEVACGELGAELRKATNSSKVASGKAAAAADARARAAKARKRLEAAVTAAGTGIAAEQKAEGRAKAELTNVTDDIARIGAQLVSYGVGGQQEFVEAANEQLVSDSGSHKFQAPNLTLRRNRCFTLATSYRTTRHIGSLISDKYYHSGTLGEAPRRASCRQSIGRAGQAGAPAGGQ